MKTNFFEKDEMLEAVTHFSNEKLSDYPEYLAAIIKIRKSSALANEKLGYITHGEAQAIVCACDKLLSDDKYLEDFQQTIIRFVGKPANKFVDKEILKNAGAEENSAIADALKLNQFTGDVTATAEAIAVHESLGQLIEALKVISGGLEVKAKEFSDIVKCGRLGLRDSFPIRLGDEFKAHSDLLKKISAEIASEKNYWTFSLLGAGDLGTGLGVYRGFKSEAARSLSEVLGYKVEPSTNVLAQMNNRYRFIVTHSLVQSAALMMWKVARDLTILASGPRAGIREIALPAVAPGSSIMPGKINPTVAELIMHICDKVFSNATGISFGVHSGWLGTGSVSSLPLKCLLNSCQLLSRACLVLQDRVVSGVTAHAKRCEAQAKSSLAYGSILKDLIGADKTDCVMRAAVNEGITIQEAYIKVVDPKEEDPLIRELFDMKNISTATGASAFMDKLTDRLTGES